MAYTNSPLVVYTKLSPNHSGQRTHAIDRITPHCVVGQATAERIAEIFEPTSRQASCNYGIGKDGRIALIVEEKNRSWCSSSSENDQRAITIEVASDNTAPYAFRDEAYAALIALCVDICKRNGKKKLLWLADKAKTLAYNPAADEMLLSVHRWFANKSCPGNWMYARMGELAAKVTAQLGGTTTQETSQDNSQDRAKTIWDTLYAAIGNSYGTAGVVGNLYAESALNPQNLQNNGNTKLGMNDAEFTAAFDSGKYGAETFIHDGYGYGLAQWTYYSRKEALLNYAKAKGASIGDLAMQLDFLISEIKGYKTVWNTLVNAKTVKEASDAVLTGYEKPADQSDTAKAKRAGYGQTYYDKYAGSTSAPTTHATCTADKLIAVAIGEIGYKEKASNSQLDDKTANTGSANYTKYARDFDQKYPNWYNGKKNGFAWCDMFVDWCFLTAFGYENALKLLYQPEKSLGAGCTYSLRYFKNKGQFHTSNPKPGDQIFFGESLSNVTHTGIVEKADGSKVYTIEGNTSNQVARRSYALTNSRILGYGRPAYDSVPDNTSPTTPSNETVYYRVRLKDNSVSSQIGAFTILQNAKNCVDANPGYYVFLDGKIVYPEEKNTDVPFLVRVSIDDLNIRVGAGTNYNKTGKYTGKGVFTITEVLTGQGSDSGWGRLKSGAGFISLDYCQRL